MLILSERDIKVFFTMKDAIAADETAFKALSSGECDVPLRINIDVPEHNGQSLYMPAYVKSIDAIGIKIVSVYPDNAKLGIPAVPAQIALLKGSTGEVICIMDGTFVTQVRTGAAAGAATKQLARQNASSAALFGTGGQAMAQLEALLTVRELKTVRVFDIDALRLDTFVKAANTELARYRAQIVAAASSDEAIKDADIITSVTTAKQPVLDGTKVKKGCHINGVGAYTPEMQELDDYLITHADKVYIDSYTGALAEAGDLIIPIRKGTYSKERVTGEIGELLLGKVPGRVSEDEITVFDTVGTAVLDVVTAHSIYNKALQLGIGTQVEM